MKAQGRSLVWQGAVATVVFALLVSLGLWQLRRLDWKEALIARIETRAKSAPVDPPARADWASLAPETYEFLHVQASGVFDSGHDVLVFAAPPAGAPPEPGYQAFTPFRLSGGGVVFVNRGFVSQSRTQGDEWRRVPPGETTVRGLLRPPQTRNSFTPADDPQKGRWFTRDPAAFAAHLGLAEVAPFTLDEEPGDENAAGLVRAMMDPAAIPNNHLSYALTWFGLAAALVVVFVVYARGRLRQG